MTSLIRSIAGSFGLRADANPLDDRYYDKDFSFTASAGPNVSKDNALRVGVFYRSVIIRAQSFAQLPIGVYQRGQKTRTEISDHPLAMAFDRPNPFQAGIEWRRDVLIDLLLWGNAYNQIVFSGDGLQFIPLDPLRIREVTKEGDRVRSYELTRQNGQKIILVGDRDVWHLKAAFGKGLLDLARNTLGLAISAEAHSSAFMRRGVKSSVVLQHPGRLKAEVAKAMGENFNAAYGGSEGYSKTPVLWEDMKVQTISIDHQKAQFLELDAATQERIATFAGVAPYMVGIIEKQTSWGTGVEEQFRTFNTLSQSPDCRYFEQDAARVFLDSGRGTNGKYVRLNDAAMLRSRNMEQAQIHEIQIRSHVKRPNECRLDLDMDPYEGGDDFPAVPGAQMGEAPNHDPSKGAEDLTDPPDSEPAKPKRMKATDKTEQLARWIAGDLLRAEAAGLMEIAKTTASDPEKWARAVSAYYGRRKGTIVESLSITPEQAEAWCKEQSRLASEGGAAALTTWTEHTGRLVALALETKEGEE